MKKTPLKRKTPLKAKHPAKRSKLTAKAPKKPKRTKLPKLTTMRNKADALLTPIVKSRHPKCLLCPAPTQVAHHHFKKSTSSACRYYLPNLIPLCNPCHAMLHHDEILWTGRVVQIMGLDWLNDLEVKKREYVKVDVHWYIENYERLSILL